MLRIKPKAAAVLLIAVVPHCAAAPRAGEDVEARAQIAELSALVHRLEARVNELEAIAAAAPPPGQPADQSAPQTAAGFQPAQPVAASKDNDILRGTTVNILMDGYYGYNFNHPIGRANLLRAFDVSSNAFSLNQADLVLENAPDPEHGKRYGLRLDLQFGQATSTLQGNAANEPRPNIYRNIFQAYGTYVAPLGKGLTIDFGKWASSLGIEGNYVQEQMNYSRSYWFDYLPFYHMGAKVNYKVNDRLSLNYWVTNGTQQTEPFNSYKDELFGFNLQPHKNLDLTINYYLGQEHPDFEYLPNATGTNLPTQQGIPFAPIVNPPEGKLHIFDAYATWTATPKLTLAAEGDYVIERLLNTSPPFHTSGGALYARYQLGPRVDIAARSEYLSDRGGLYTGVTQALKEVTLTFEQRLGPGFALFEEWRTDFSNHPFFLTGALGVLKKQQSTATLGVVWWFGAKPTPW